MKPYFLALALVLTGCFSNAAPSGELLEAGGKFENAGTLNIALGKQAPDFTLPMTAETNERLADITNDSNAIIVFFRGYWCPFCKHQLKDYESLLDEMEKKNIRLIAISPDTIDDTIEFAKQFDQRMLFLADTNSDVIREYGILKDDKLPHPATIFVDRTGSILWFYVNDNFKERPSAAQIRQQMNAHF